MEVGEGDREKKWSKDTRAAIFKLSPEDGVIVVTKFPKVGNVESLPRSQIWSQEEGVFNNFALEHEANLNIKRLDFRAGLSPSLKSPEASQGLGTMEGRGYLYTSAAKERLGFSPDKKE